MTDAVNQRKLVRAEIPMCHVCKSAMTERGRIWWCPSCDEGRMYSYWGLYVHDPPPCERCTELDASIDAVEKELAERFPDGYNPRTFSDSVAEVITEMESVVADRHPTAQLGAFVKLPGWIARLKGTP